MTRDEIVAALNHLDRELTASMRALHEAVVVLQNLILKVER